jgi:hypothetical protein
LPESEVASGVGVWTAATTRASVSSMARIEQW